MKNANLAKLQPVPCIRAIGAIVFLLFDMFALATSGTANAERLSDIPKQRVVQVNLATHAKISQYLDIGSSTQGYGKNACGLVAAAAAVGGDQWVDMVGLIARAAGSDYHADSGIQPSKYVVALQKVFGSTNVTALNATDIDTLYQELETGNIVIADFQVNETTQTPLALAPSYAHFARVLGIDKDREEIYIENTLRGSAYWTVSFDDFLAAWKYPETTSSRIPDPARAENVTNWAVVLDSALLTRDFTNEL